MEKRKINIDREPLTSAEIKNRQDFEKILQNTPPPVKPFYQTGWFATTIAGLALVVGIGTTVFLLRSNEEKDAVAESKHTMASPPPPKEDVVDKFNYDEDTPCVHPPIAELDVPFSNYKANNQKGSTIFHPSGTKIFIEPGSFVDESGVAIEGTVDLAYREFHDQIDIFLSGIPMHYDSANIDYNLESAGMFEIKGLFKGKPVRINPTTPLEIQLQSVYDGTSYNQYQLDEEADQWVYLGKDNLEHDVATELIKHPLSKEEENYLNSDEYKQEEAYLKTTDKALKQQLKIVQRAEKSVRQQERKVPNKPKKLNKSNYQFDIDIDPREFPELSGFSQTKFEVAPKDNSFSPEVYNITWEDIRLRQKDNNKNYDLTLSKPEEQVTFEVYPVFEGSGFDNAMVDYREKFKVYEQELNKRKAKEHQLRKTYEAAYADYKERKANHARKLNEAKANRRTQQDVFFATNAKQELTTGSKVKRVFSVLSFGIYNSDHPVFKPIGIPIEVFAHDESGTPIELVTMQSIQEDVNTVYSYDGPKFQNITFDNTKKNLLLGVFDGGKLAVATPADFKNVQWDNGQHHFTMQVYQPGEITQEALKNMIR